MMSTYDFSHLVKLWSLESITSEQAIGQILLHLQSVLDRVQVLERRVPLQEEEKEAVNEIRSEEATEEVEVDLGVNPAEDDSVSGFVPEEDE